MLCKICRHCGLCEGDGKIQQNNLSVEAGLNFCEPLSLDEESSRFAPNCFGIAVDVGTTTVAATAWSFFQKKKLCQVSQSNGQRIFGADVISRLSYAATESGYEKLREAILLQLEKIIVQMNMELSPLFLSSRIGRPELKRIVLTGNTTMLSIIRGASVEGLSCFPFQCESLFGETVSSSQVFNNSSALKLIPNWSLFPSQDFAVTFAPCVSAFVGGDTVCAMLSTGFFRDDGKTKYLADVGTNCEMAAMSPDGKIVCTSSSAGPAFEGQGISKGMAACEGAVAAVEWKDGEMKGKTIGGVEATGVCGTGLLSAMAQFYLHGIVNENGTFMEGTEEVFLSKNVSITQKDVRNFQLAKAAVYSGLEYLEKAIGPAESPTLFLCGGFGTKLNPQDAADVKMIPAFLSENVVPSGNAALAGALMILLDSRNLSLCVDKAKSAQSLDLAMENGFQESFIKALNF